MVDSAAVWQYGFEDLNNIRARGRDVCRSHSFPQRLAFRTITITTTFLGGNPHPSIG
jgi:hypothetical protein